MLFAPEVQLEQEQHEKELKGARAFFKEMPENGIIIHGGLNEYASAKKHKGLKVSYHETCYYYIQKPDETEREDNIISAYKNAIKYIGDVAGYSFGETSPVFTARSNSNILASEFLNPREIYKGHKELEPSFLCYKATTEVHQRFDDMFHTLPLEVRISDNPVDSSNLLFEISMNYRELSRFPALNEATSGFKSKVIERIKSKGWTKETPPSDFQLEKDGKYLSIPDLVTEMLNKSSKDPIYAEAIAISQKAHVDINRFLEVLKYLIEETQLITKEEFASARHPMALYELSMRYKQIKESGLSHDEKRQRVLRMIGSSETSRFKREYATLQGIHLAATLRHKYGDTFAGMVLYGSQMDRYKGNSPEIDLKVLTKPNQDPSKDYGKDNQIVDDIVEYMLKQMGLTCEPTIIYTTELAEQQKTLQTEMSNNIAAKNSGLDARCVPIIFGRENRKLFNSVFQENLKHIQTK